jgi:predicted metalloprotease with PDZ domain
VWREFGRGQTAELAPARPYTVADLRRVLGEVTRDSAFANDFFRRYIQGREVVDYGALLANAGFLLRRSQAGRPVLAVQLDSAAGGVLVAGYPPVFSSFYGAGIDRGDLVVSVDGRPTLTPDALREAVNARAAGETVTVEFVQRGERKTARMTLTENPSMEAVTYESAGMQVMPEMRAFREAWLRSQVSR